MKNEKYIAYCKIYIKSFCIDNSGLSQVKSHVKCRKLESIFNNQRTIQVSKSSEVHCSKLCLIVSTEDQVNKAEVLQALHIVNKNLSEMTMTISFHVS